MNTRLMIKFGLLLPVLVFAAIVLLVLVGCMGCLLQLGDEFYCGPYCIIAEIVQGMTVFLFFFLIFPDIKSVFIIRKNASSNKK